MKTLLIYKIIAFFFASTYFVLKSNGFVDDTLPHSIEYLEMIKNREQLSIQLHHTYWDDIWLGVKALITGAIAAFFTQFITPIAKTFGEQISSKIKSKFKKKELTVNHNHELLVNQ